MDDEEEDDEEEDAEEEGDEADGDEEEEEPSIESFPPPSRLLKHCMSVVFPDCRGPMKINVDS